MNAGNFDLIASSTMSMAGNAPGALTAPASRKDELSKYAKEFEASLIKDWWKESQNSIKGQSGDQQSPDSETISDMGAQSLATGIVAHGGIGIANMLVHSLLGVALGK